MSHASQGTLVSLSLLRSGEPGRVNARPSSEWGGVGGGDISHPAKYTKPTLSLMRHSECSWMYASAHEIRWRFTEEKVGQCSSSSRREQDPAPNEGIWMSRADWKVWSDEEPQSQHQLFGLFKISSNQCILYLCTQSSSSVKQQHGKQWEDVIKWCWKKPKWDKLCSASY